MALFDQLGKLITNAGQETATKARNFADITKLNGEIDQLQQKIDCLYFDLGKAYYERHKNDGVFYEDPERMMAIRDAFEEIARYQEQIDQIRGMEKCQNCGASIPAGSIFCNACGTKIVREDPPRASGTVCPQCHTEVGPNDLFCMSCGADLRENGKTEET